MRPFWCRRPPSTISSKDSHGDRRLRSTDACSPAFASPAGSQVQAPRTAGASPNSARVPGHHTGVRNLLTSRPIGTQTCPALNRARALYTTCQPPQYGDTLPHAVRPVRHQPLTTAAGKCRAGPNRQLGVAVIVRLPAGNVKSARCVSSECDIVTVHAGWKTGTVKHIRPTHEGEACLPYIPILNPPPLCCRTDSDPPLHARSICATVAIVGVAGRACLMRPRHAVSTRLVGPV